MHQGWQGWWQGCTALCRCGSPVHYRGGSLGWATRCVVLCGAMHHGVAIAVSRVVAGCNLHQTKRRQSCPGWEVDEPCLPQTHIPQLFLLLIIIIIAVFVEHFPQTLIIVEHFPKTLKKKKDEATFPTFAIAHTHTLLLLRRKIELISRDVERKF